jgi:IS5 family transposase
VFAGLAQMGGKTLRSIGLARARLHLNWKVAAYNLQRLVYLKEAGAEAF